QTTVTMAQSDPNNAILPTSLQRVGLTIAWVAMPKPQAAVTIGALKENGSAAIDIAAKATGAARLRTCPTSRTAAKRIRAAARNSKLYCLNCADCNIAVSDKPARRSAAPVP